MALQVQGGRLREQELRLERQRPQRLRHPGGHGDGDAGRARPEARHFCRKPSFRRRRRPDQGTL